VSMGRDVTHMGSTVRTGIFKEPVTGRVRLRKLNLDGDAQSDLVAHGGIYKAAYVYSIENYEFWKHKLNRTDFTFGQFGENFTANDMLEDTIHIGDVFRVGNAIVEVTQPSQGYHVTSLESKCNFQRFPRCFCQATAWVSTCGSCKRATLARATLSSSSKRVLNR